MSSTNNIAKNSLFLYFRMFLNMGLGLFTAGIVLNTLGITDYGIYNIVGGFVSMFSFLNSSMSSATQRFLSYDIGKNDLVQLKKTFSTTVTIHFGIALLIVVALETFGLWYINNKLNVPVERMSTVNIVFQFSVLSSFFAIIQVPYNALITAHERFQIFAYISIVEIGFKLLILYFLIHLNQDKLILYSILLFFSSFIIRMIYRIYCRRNFPESKYSFFFDRSYFKTLISFTGWNLFTNVAFVSKNQGVNLLLNFFFGTVVNAAYGITSQIQGIVLNFVSNFQNAVNPQIVKNYASGNYEKSYKLMQQSCKFSFGLMMIIVFPILISLESILDLWLKNYPHQSIIFIKLAFINILIDTICNPIVFLIQATGNIKKHQIIIGCLLLMNLPISYLMLKMYNDPKLIFIISICITFLSLIIRLYLLKKLINLDIMKFFNQVLFRIFLLSLMVIILYKVYQLNELYFSDGLLKITVYSFFSFLISSILSFLILLDQKEKNNLIVFISSYIKKRFLKIGS